MPITMPMLTAVFVAGAFFTTYEGVKHILGNLTWPTGAQRSPQSQNVTYSLLPTPVVHAIASSCGEMVSCLMITPAEVLKQNAQVVHNQGNGQGGGGVGGGRGRAGRNASLEVISRFRHKPWKLWSGYTALVGRNLPFTGLHFPLFEYVRSHLVDWREARNKSSPEGPGSRWNPIIERATLTGLAAGFAGTVASVITTPIDVIKTRVMLAATDSPASADSSGSGGGDNVIKDEKVKRKFATLDVGREIYRKEGIRGLFRGGLLKAGWTALGLGLYLAFYEGGRLYLENRRKDKENGGRKEGDSIV